MAISLHILPFKAKTNHSHTVLDFGFIDREMYNNLKTLINKKGKDIPKHFSGFLSRDNQGEYTYGEMTSDVYGDPIKVISSKDFIKEVSSQKLRKEKEAVISFLKSFPKYKIALFWE